jgi:glycerol-3-phosphate cytidylyltransferase-like family protein
MDTRHKIVGSWPHEATIVEGCFDPLLASHAEQLAARKSDLPLVVVIRDPEDPLLDARSRAELVASLRVVDAVVIGGPLEGERITEDRGALFDVIRAKHGR